jgi:sugar phosphate isomerase/epimerase
VAFSVIGVLLADDGHPAETVALCVKHGFGIEVQAFFDPVVAERDSAALEEHSRLIAPLGLRSVHGCFGDLCPGSFDPMVREVARNRFELSYAVAKRLAATHLVLHHGYVPHTSPPNRWLPRCVAFWKDFLSDKDGSIRMHIENMLELDPGLLADLVDAIDKPWVDVNLDVGHAHCNSKSNIEGWIRSLGKRIGYVHLHDNHGAEDEHLSFGKGNLPLRETLSMLKELVPAALWVVEVDTECLEECINWLGEKGFLSETAQV